MLSEDEIGTLSIDRMVFHVVRPDVPDPLFLAEAVPPQFPEFFVKRVVDTLRGASYDFNEGSGMPALVSRRWPRRTRMARTGSSPRREASRDVSRKR